MKRLFFLLIFLASFTYSQAQDFLVKHNGDTLKGDVRVSGKTISITEQGRSDTIIPADDIAYVNSSRYKGTVLHCQLTLYSDNIDVVQKWDYTGVI